MTLFHFYFPTSLLILIDFMILMGLEKFEKINLCRRISSKLIICVTSNFGLCSLLPLSLQLWK